MQVIAPTAVQEWTVKPMTPNEYRKKHKRCITCKYSDYDNGCGGDKHGNHFVKRKDDRDQQQRGIT